MAENFNAYSSYYDLLYADKDYQAESDYISTIIKKYRPATKTLIEFGAGTGIHANLLSTAGYSIVAIEPSTTMLNIAALKTKDGLSFKKGDMLSFKSTQSFDAAIALFHVVSYLQENDTLIQSFQNVYNHLAENGLFIFDIWYTPAVLTQLPEKRTKTMENNLLKVTRNAEPAIHWNKNTIDVHYDIHIYDKVTGSKQNFKEVHTMRHFSLPELSLLARTTGFELLLAEEFLSAKESGPDTWGISIVLKKQPNFATHSS